MEAPANKPADQSEVVLEKGRLEVPTSLIIGIVTCLVTSVGSCSAAAFQTLKAGQTEDNQKQVIQVQVDIATMKNDIQWIKNKLSESDRQESDSR